MWLRAASLPPSSSSSEAVSEAASEAASEASAWGAGGASFTTAAHVDVFPGTAQWVGGVGGQLRSPPLALPAGTVKSAVVRATGVGSFYVYVNGARVGGNVMDPPQTVYSKTVLYSTFDVTAMLVGGQRNYVGALLGTYKFG